MRLKETKLIFLRSSVLFFLATIVCLFACRDKGTPEMGLSIYPEITENQFLEDFDIFRGIYEQANAGLYKYHDKASMDSLFDAQRGMINDKTTYREFYNILWKVIDFTGSCHNYLHYPEELIEELYDQKVFFPLPLKFVEGQLVTNMVHEEIPLGSKIFQVNGMDVKTFHRQVAQFTSTDGHNTTGKDSYINSGWLSFYVYLVLGEQECFSVQYIAPNSTELKEGVLESVTDEVFMSNYSRRHSKEYEELFHDELSFDILDNQGIGILEVRTFAFGDTTTLEHDQYASFIDSVFHSMRQSGVDKLIVDIRANGGGDDPNDLLLYSYLTRRPFKENKEAYTIFQDIPFREYYADDDIDELPGDLKEEHSIYLENKYFQYPSFNPVWEPHSNAFEGQLVLLVDADVASAASLFASMIKSDGRAIVIGEETMGGYYGHTGHIPVTYRLPNSELELTFSIVDLEQDVVPLYDQEPGRGVMPHHTVVQSYEDFMAHKDVQLGFAIEKITE